MAQGSGNQAVARTTSVECTAKPCGTIRTQFENKNVEVAAVESGIITVFGREILAGRCSKHKQVTTAVNHQTVRIFVVVAADICGIQELFPVWAVFADRYIGSKVGGCNSNASPVDRLIRSCCYRIFPFCIVYDSAGIKMAIVVVCGRKPKVVAT
jgi:hypothetical protein